VEPLIIMVVLVAVQVNQHLQPKTMCLALVHKVVLAGAVVVTLCQLVVLE
jgi:hypothetical protein